MSVGYRKTKIIFLKHARIVVGKWNITKIHIIALVVVSMMFKYDK